MKKGISCSFALAIDPSSVRYRCGEDDLMLVVPPSPRVPEGATRHDNELGWEDVNSVLASHFFFLCLI